MFDPGYHLLGCVTGFESGEQDCQVLFLAKIDEHDMSPVHWHYFFWNCDDPVSLCYLHTMGITHLCHISVSVLLQCLPGI